MYISGVSVSRLRIDVPSRKVPSHVHAAGTEFAPVRRVGPDAWLIEIRVPDETLLEGAWYEEIEVPTEATELAEIDE